MKIVKILFVKKNSLNHNVVVPSQLLSLLQKHSFPNPAHRVNNNIKYYQIVKVYHLKIMVFWSSWAQILNEYFYAFS